MVSPTPTTAQPPLSYAESAKKAQSIKPTSQHSQRFPSNPPRQPPVPAPAPEPKKPGKLSPTTDTAQISLTDLSLRDAPAPGASGANPPSHTSPGESAAHVPSSREVATNDSPSSDAVPSVPPSQPPAAKPAPVPVTNVWNQRIQQRAQARSQPRPSQSHPQTAPSHAPRAPSPPRDPSAASSGSRQPDVLIPATVQPAQIPSSSSLNGGASPSSSGPSTGTTPSSRKELPLSPHPPPSVTDAESWPEVGKSCTSFGKSQRVANGHTAVAEVHDTEEKDADVPLPSHPGTPRKSERTKWIVIPPEELQAAADAINPPRPYSQSRNHAQYGPRNSHTRSNAASASGSAQGSQAPSKVTSGRTSASHSRAHSPNSIASSPRHPGRGRQLPVDARGAQAPEQQHRSSQGNSPQVQADMGLVAPVPYAQISRDVYGYGNAPIQTTNAQSFVPPPPPPPPQPQPPHYPPALQVNPSHTQQSYASSSVSPYPQPYAHHAAPDRYGPAPTQPLPPGWPAPEHYVFPYGYPPYAQAHPIMYWPGNLPLDLRQDGRAIYPSYPSPSVHPHPQVVPPPHVLQDDGDPPREEESILHPALPPPTLIARPPPPQESDAVAGYRAVGPVTEPGTQWEETVRGRRDVIFGSIGAPGESKSPSPPPAVEDQPEKPERVATTFSVGVTPGDAPSSHARSRTRSQLRLSHAESPLDGKDLEADTTAEVKIVNLTNPEIKWEFGTANRAQDEPTQGDENRPELLERQSRPLAPAAPPKPTLDVSLLFSGSLQSSSMPVPSTEPPLAEVQHPYPHAHHSIPYGLPQHQMHVPPIPPVQEELQVQTGPGAYPVHQPPMQSLSSSSADGFEVKNFGYGFGRPNEPGHAVTSPRDERFPREREWERSREVERESYGWRPRRGSYNGHNERGGFGGRRGRGTNGFGRGVSGRGFGRGGFRHQHYHQHPNQQQHQKQQQQQQQQQQPQPQSQPPQPQPQLQQSPSFTVTPPAQPFQPLQPSTPPPRTPADMGQYLGTTIQQPYVPHGFEAYQAPVPLSYPPNTNAPAPAPGHPLPRPLSNLTFPLDPTRFYLLGQLEYYLSAQNLVSDIFLRKRMDSRGWIPISLLASFNRVRQLTLEPQLVREVLALSQVVEMRDDCVRMGGGEWVQFVLPDAPVSTVEAGSVGMGHGEDGGGDQDRDPAEEDADVEEEEEEEEIEIVMDREVIGQPWMAP